MPHKDKGDLGDRWADSRKRTLFAEKKAAPFLSNIGGKDTPLLKVFMFTAHASLQGNIDFCLEKGNAHVMEADQRKKKK